MQRQSRTAQLSSLGQRTDIREKRRRGQIERRLHSVTSLHTQSCTNNSRGESEASELAVPRVPRSIQIKLYNVLAHSQLGGSVKICLFWTLYTSGLIQCVVSCVFILSQSQGPSLCSRRNQYLLPIQPIYF